MSLRNTLKAGVTALAVGAATIALSGTASAFSFGGLSHASHASRSFNPGRMSDSPTHTLSDDKRAPTPLSDDAPKLGGKGDKTDAGEKGGKAKDGGTKEDDPNADGHHVVTDPDTGAVTKYDRYGGDTVVSGPGNSYIHGRCDKDGVTVTFCDPDKGSTVTGTFVGNRFVVTGAHKKGDKPPKKHRAPRPIRHVKVHGWTYYLAEDRDTGELFIQIEDENGNDVHIDGSITMPGGSTMFPVR